ncbi:MAG: hypothetical protein GKS02_12300 [Alphaproteobacteria bacterium]|nr:hypothetical protein [Alphaproteobacteria bacterium]
MQHLAPVWRQAARYVAMVSLAVPTLVAGSQVAQGSGFALREQSATAMGNAFAGATAAAEDVSYMFFNPAGLTRHSGNQASLSVTYIAPRSELEGASASTVLGGSLSGSTTRDDIGVNGVLPANYGFFDLHPDFKAAIALNVPFGLETDYEDDWVGRYHALNSKLLTVDVNPTVAYRVNDWLSLGAGVQVNYIDVSLTNAVDFGTIAFAQTVGAVGVPGQQDGEAKVEGDDVGFGYTFGALVEPLPGTRFGVGYRSKIEHEVEGEAKFLLDGSGTAAILQGLATPSPFVDTGAAVTATLPETASFGVYHELDDQWAVMGEAAWTRWSQFYELRIRFDNPGQPDNFTETSYNNTWFFAVGATYRWTDNWTFRVGAAYDESPIPDETRTPRIPDEDRYWTSLGAAYTPFPELTVNLSYTHIFVDDPTINLSTGGTGNTFRGNLAAEYNGSVDLFGLQATYRF